MDNRKKLLYVTGSYPENQEGIAASAKVLLDAMANHFPKEDIVLLTTDVPVITDSIEGNAQVPYKLMQDWRMRPRNVKRFLQILSENEITDIHMEYPGDLYGKTFLATFIPLLIRLYNRKHKTQIRCNVRLHEFTRARLLRRMAIVPILLYANGIWVPALEDRKAVARFAGNRVHRTLIGSNIVVTEGEKDKMAGKVVISYFGSVYPGKGIERMLALWKAVKERDSKNRFVFKIIGEIDVNPDNHFLEYHKLVRAKIAQLGLQDDIIITGYVSDEEASVEIRNTDMATLLYEDGLSLRRGSFIAYLSHGVPIITTEGDEEACELMKDVDGVFMTEDDRKMMEKIYEWSEADETKIEKMRENNRKASAYADWNEIAAKMLREYGLA